MSVIAASATPLVGHTFRGYINFFAEKGIENPCHSLILEIYFVLERTCQLSLKAPLVGRTFRGLINYFEYRASIPFIL